jgi:microcystin degradation protein MlrC
LAVSLGTAHALRVADERAAMNTVASQARSYARELRTRLTASELVVQTLTSDDAGSGGAELRAHILRSDIFRGVGDRGSRQGPATAECCPTSWL